MKTALIVFASSVSGSRLKNLTQRAQIHGVKITQTPGSIKSNRCSYSLRVYINDLDEILKIAARNNIRFSGVYAEEHDMSGTVMYRKM